MSDEIFHGFNKAGKSADRGKPTAPASGLTPMSKQLFYRLQERDMLTLTPQEKTALLELYQKAYPAFYARELATAQKKRTGWALLRKCFRAVGWVLSGILIVFILALFFRLL